MRNNSYSTLFKVLILISFLMLEKSAEAHGENNILYISLGFFTLVIVHIAVFLSISWKSFVRFSPKKKFALLSGCIFLFFSSFFLFSFLGSFFHAEIWQILISILLPLISTILFAVLIKKTRNNAG